MPSANLAIGQDMAYHPFLTSPDLAELTYSVGNCAGSCSFRERLPISAGLLSCDAMAVAL
jgi:hypothetical protein